MLYNAGAWPDVQAIAAPLRVVWLRGARMLASPSHGRRPDFFQLDVLRRMELESIDVMISKARLRFFPRFLAHAPKAFCALAQYTAS